MNRSDFKFMVGVLAVEMVVYAAISAPAILFLPGHWYLLGIVLGMLGSGAVADGLIRRRRQGSERKA